MSNHDDVEDAFNDHLELEPSDWLCPMKDLIGCAMHEFTTDPFKQDEVIDAELDITSLLEEHRVSEVIRFCPAWDRIAPCDDYRVCKIYCRGQSIIVNSYPLVSFAGTLAKHM